MISIVSVPRISCKPQSVLVDVNGIYLKFMLYCGKLKEVMRYKDSRIYDCGTLDIPRLEYTKAIRAAMAILRGGRI